MGNPEFLVQTTLEEKSAPVQEDLLQARRWFGTVLEGSPGTSLGLWLGLVSSSSGSSPMHPVHPIINFTSGWSTPTKVQGGILVTYVSKVFKSRKT